MLHRRWRLGLASLALIALLPLILAAAGPLVWEPAPSAPVSGGHGQGLVSDGQNIYLAQCFDADNDPEFFRYVSGAWEPLSTAGLSEGAFRSGTALAWDPSGRIYALGGARDEDDDRTAFFRFEVGTNRWTALSVTPHPQGAGNALSWCGFDNKLYAFMGSEDHSAGASFFASYEPTRNLWTPLSMPWPNTDAGAALAWTGSKTILALRGGCTGDFASYDIPTDTWTDLAALPSPAGYGASLLWTSAVGDTVYALAGGCDEDPGIGVYAYSLVTRTWTAQNDIPCPVGYYAGNRLAFADGALYVYQGSPTASPWSCGGDAFHRAVLIEETIDPCEICLERLIDATKKEFEDVQGVNAVMAAALAELPFRVTACSTRRIEDALDAVPGMTSAIARRILKEFCPEL